MNYVDRYVYYRNDNLIDALDICSTPIRILLGGRTVYVESGVTTDPLSLTGRVIGCAAFALSFYLLPAAAVLFAVVTVLSFVIGTGFKYGIRDDKTILDKQRHVEGLIPEYQRETNVHAKLTILYRQIELRNNPKIEFDAFVKKIFNEVEPAAVGRLIRYSPLRLKYIQEAFENDWKKDLLTDNYYQKLCSKYKTILELAEYEISGINGPVFVELFKNHTDFSPVQMALMTYFFLSVNSTRIRIQMPDMPYFNQLKGENKNFLNEFEDYLSLSSTLTYAEFRPSLDPGARNSEYLGYLWKKLNQLQVQTELCKDLKNLLNDWREYYRVSEQDLKNLLKNSEQNKELHQTAKPKPDFGLLVWQTQTVGNVENNILSNEQLIDSFIIAFWKRSFIQSRWAF